MYFASEATVFLLITEQQHFYQWRTNRTRKTCNSSLALILEWRLAIERTV